MSDCRDRHRRVDVDRRVTPKPLGSEVTTSGLPGSDLPMVSVVIPTYSRPELVGRAVRSALAQTLQSLEVIVVVDGRDNETIDALRTLKDDRLEVHVPEKRLGQSAARNLGVGRSRGRWVAFLDDDDIWMPEKLERQIETAEAAPFPHPIVSCRLIARTETRDFVWPRRFPRPKETIDEYLFCRRLPMHGEGLVQTSTILTDRELLTTVPFRSELTNYEDFDWLLRASRLEGVRVLFIPTQDPMVVWHLERTRPRASDRDGWQAALPWIQHHNEWITPRAYSGFLLGEVSAGAARRGDWSAFTGLFGEAFRRGRPSPMQILNHLANYCLPTRLQSVLAGLAAKFWR